MVKVFSSTLFLAAITVIQGAAISKESNGSITPYANEPARVVGTLNARVQLLMSSNYRCVLSQNGNTIFQTYCSANDFSGQKCSKCVSNNNLKLCVDQDGCSLYDSNGWKFWSSGWMTIKTQMVPCKDNKPGAGCTEVTGELSADVRI